MHFLKGEIFVIPIFNNFDFKHPNTLVNCQLQGFCTMTVDKSIILCFMLHLLSNSTFEFLKYFRDK